MMPSLSLSVDSAAIDGPDQFSPIVPDNFRPDLVAVLRQLIAEFPGLAADEVRSVFVSCLASLDTVTQGSHPELLYRLAGQRLSDGVHRSDAGNQDWLTVPGPAARPPRSRPPRD